MKEKKAIAILAVFVAASLVIPPVLAATTESTTTPISENEFKHFEVPVVGYSGSGDILVAGSDDDEFEPVIETDANGNLLVAYTVQQGVFESDVLLAKSTDGGSSWSIASPPWGDLEGLQHSPAMIYYPGGGAIVGTFADASGGWQMFFKVPDVSDETTYDYNGWGGFEEIIASAVSYTTFEDGLKIIVTPLAGTSSGFEGTCMWAYADFEEMSGYGGSYYYDAQSRTGAYTDASNMKGFAFASNHYGFVCDAFREETGVVQPLIKWTVYEEEPDLEYTDHQFWLENGITATDPDAVGTGNNIYVTYTAYNPAFGDYDIKCKYSHDGGASWDESMAASAQLVDETNSAIYASGNTVFITYVKQGNLYLVKSEDGGATWGEPDQVNGEPGTVVAEPGATSISRGGIVWVDTRNGNKDIYYAPLPCAIINVKDISGGMGISATITNTGTEDASNVDWSIELTGLIFIGKETTGTIDSLPAGGEEAIKSGLVFGIGPTTITITAGGASKTAKGFVLGPLVLGVK
ncbi:MAG: sialidase family protein [Candidatus Thermoplasmatota archaeon]|nr:sialidase family protein [Candidatus Thermoplasmatota archaeon]